jgi:hypothetical protein
MHICHLLLLHPQSKAGQRDVQDSAVIAALQADQTRHDCVSSYWADKAWICTGLAGQKAMKNLVFKFVNQVLEVERVIPSHARTGGFFHLHSWKQSFTWHIQPDGYYGGAVRFSMGDDLLTMHHPSKSTGR